MRGNRGPQKKSGRQLRPSTMFRRPNTPAKEGNFSANSRFKRERALPYEVKAEKEKGGKEEREGVSRRRWEAKAPS